MSIGENRDFRNDVIDLLKCISDLEKDNEILNNFLVKTALENEILLLEDHFGKLRKGMKSYQLLCVFIVIILLLLLILSIGS